MRFEGVMAVSTGLAVINDHGYKSNSGRGMVRSIL
jgi:hypothetical protein